MKAIISLLLLTGCATYKPKLNATNYNKQMKVINKQAIKIAKKVKS